MSSAESRIEELTSQGNTLPLHKSCAMSSAQICLLCATERGLSTAWINHSWMVTLGNSPVTRPTSVLPASQHRMRENSGKAPMQKEEASQDKSSLWLWCQNS